MSLTRLKQRVLLVASLGIIFLFLLKYKLERDELYFETARLSINKLSEEYDDWVESHAFAANDHSHFHMQSRKANPIESFLTKKHQPAIVVPDPVGVISPERSHPWLVWREMVRSDAVTPADKWQSIKDLLEELATAPVKKAEVGVKGSQLKLSLHLDGPIQQQVVYRPMRYSRTKVIAGKAYYGYDRHNGEIAAFHLDYILGFNRAPPVAGRIIDLDREIIPHASSELRPTFNKNDKNDTCFYGVCYYCKPEWPACGVESKLEGSLTIWLPKRWSLKATRHPWQRTYSDKRKARWEKMGNYCDEVKQKRPYDKGRLFLDIMDTSIFDFLIANADRHHYETFTRDGSDGMLLHLDNAKSFGNPNEDDMSILAPVSQCCRLRKSTYEMLLSFDKRKGTTLSALLRRSMSIDRVAPVLSDLHLASVDRRLKLALNVVAKCVAEFGHDTVLSEVV